MLPVSTILVILAAFLITLDPFQPAFAYLDPGSGSMLLQLLLGGIAGAGMVLKLYWRRLRDKVIPKLKKP